MSNRIKLKGTSEKSFDIGLSNKQTFDASGFTANHVWVLPDSDGSLNYVLSTDGANNLSWQPNAAVASDQTTPYFIPNATTFVNNINKQNLFSIDIDVEGTLEINGILAEVD